MKINSIKAKLLVLLFLSISCSFFILGMYNTSNNYNDKNINVIAKIENLSHENARFINAYLESKVRIIASLAKINKEISTENNNYNKIINNLVIAKEAGDFISVYSAYENN